MTESQNSRPIHSQGLLLGAVAGGILILAVYLTSNIVESENGGISAAVRTIGICLAILSFVRPKAGLYIVTVEAFSVDFVKKVAVYYGTASMGTIIEVLVVSMLALTGTILGVLIQGVALRRHKVAPLNWAILGASLILGSAVFLASRGEAGFEKAGENAFNCAVPVALALPMTIFLADRDELHKLLRLQFWLAVIWAVWGIRQYYFGFTQLEWFYAETGLSLVASQHMFMPGGADPRPFGFGSGAPNYGVISVYVTYGVWHLSQFRRKRLIYGLGTLIVFWGLVTSLQRTSLLIPFIVLGFYYFFRTKGRTIFAYTSAILIFLLGVTFAEYLYNHLDDINHAISTDGYWGEKVLNVSTFSDRLASWMTLKSPEIYSMFGIHDNIGSHDIFTRIVVSYGVVGLTVVLLSIGTGAWFLHRTLLRIADPDDRKFATFLLATTAPSIALGMAGGGNFTTNPTNIQIWTFFGAAVSLVIHSKLVDPVTKPSLATIREILARQATDRRPMALRDASSRVPQS